eukprot:442644_1
MSSSKTTSEVKVSNKLNLHAVWVRIDADRTDATQLSTTKHQHNTQNIYDQNQYSISNADSNYQNEERDESKYTNDKTHDKLTYNSASSNTSSYSSGQSQSSSGRGGGSVSFLGFKAGGSGAKVSKSSSNSSGSSCSSSSLSTSKDNFRQNIAANSLSTVDETASTKYTSDAAMNISSAQNTNIFKSSSNATLTHKTIEPGFVRITPLQSLTIPVIVMNDSQVAYITVYILDKYGEKIVIANQLQTNRQVIEIRRNKLSNYIEIASESESVGKHNKYRKKLLEWGLPEYLCDAMNQAGWTDLSLWDDITQQHLINMGFKDGHRAKFNAEYAEYKRFKRRVRKVLTYKDLMSKWRIPMHLYENMKDYGWDDIELWNQINDDDFKLLQFERGHVLKFKKHIKDNAHIKEFEMMQEDLKQAKPSKFAESNHNEDEEEDDELKSEFDVPHVPIFTIDETDIYHSAIDFKMNKTYKNEIINVELKEENGDDDWKIMTEITQVKTHRIDGLKIQTSYLIRARAQKFKKKSKYSDIIKIKTKDKKWRDNNLPEIPSFKYRICPKDSSHSAFIIHFEDTEMEEIKVTKYNQKYMITYALTNSYDDEKEQNHIDISWKDLCLINKSTLKYELALNDNDLKYKYLLIRICGNNDLDFILK